VIIAQFQLANSETSKNTRRVGWVGEFTVASTVKCEGTPWRHACISLRVSVIHRSWD